MIYLIHPQKQSTHFQKQLLALLAEYFPSTKITICSKAPPFSIGNNLYFIINENTWTQEKSLQLMREIRKSEKQAKMVYLTPNPDYLALFRSHIALFTVIDLRETDVLRQIQDCLKKIYLLFA